MCRCCGCCVKKRKRGGKKNKKKLFCSYCRDIFACFKMNFDFEIINTIAIEIHRIREVEGKEGV